MTNITSSIFPKFKRIAVRDKSHIESFTDRHAPYADYNFYNYVSWDTENIHAISKLNDNLVFTFADYVDGTPFFSFIGVKKPITTALTLLNESVVRKFEPELKLVPEFLANKLRKSHKLTVKEDISSHDYIMSIKKIATFSGKKFKSKRQAANSIGRKFNISITFEPFNRQNLKKVSAFLKNWESAKLQANKNVDIAYERHAIEQMMKLSENQNDAMLTLAHIDDKLVGFSVDEMLPRKYVLSHYFKTLPEYPGLTEYMNRHIAVHLNELGYKYWNWQQDLGIATLKNMKLGYRPLKQLKKYIVTLS